MGKKLAVEPHEKLTPTPHPTCSTTNHTYSESLPQCQPWPDEPKNYPCGGVTRSGMDVPAAGVEAVQDLGAGRRLQGLCNDEPVLDQPCTRGIWRTWHSGVGALAIVRASAAQGWAAPLGQRAAPPCAEQANNTVCDL